MRPFGLLAQIIHHGLPSFFLLLFLFLNEKSFLLLHHFTLSLLDSHHISLSDSTPDGLVFLHIHLFGLFDLLPLSVLLDQLLLSLQLFYNPGLRGLFLCNFFLLSFEGLLFARFLFLLPLLNLAPSLH